jgi:beta-aspartyl-peptidase (threonine type)
MTVSPAWSLVVHGGCGQLAPDRLPGPDADCRAGLAAALAAGQAVLAAGGPALEAVIAAVMVLEDDPLFNAGRGSVLTADGTVELDAAVMEGATRAAGAVAGVTATRNPVRLARAVMDHSPHLLLARDGADVFAREQGLADTDNDWFITPLRQQALAAQQAAAARGESLFDAAVKYGTVGAVARDAAGHMAAATSTGGLTGKRWGRIGDSPLIGAGTWADDRSIAVSATGTGEAFIRAAAAHDVAARMRHGGATAAAAAGAVLAEVQALHGQGGLIWVDADGRPGWRFSTSGMFRGCVTADQLAQVAIYAHEG